VNQTKSNNNTLDLRSFPSQTDVSFLIIVLVILGVMIAGSFGPSPILMWPTTLTMIILPLRAWLSWPEQEIKRRQDYEATVFLTQNGALHLIQTTLTELAQQAKHHTPVKIIISHQALEMRSLGTWQRHYLLLGQQMAQRLSQDLQSPIRARQDRARAALLHELAHFLHRDVQRIGYTRELLRSCFIVISWWMVFLLGWLGFSTLSFSALLNFDLTQIAGIDPILINLLEPIITLSPAQRAEIVTKAETISFNLVINYIVNAFWTVLLMGFVLWLFFWRRMVRLQEHQADYFVSKTIQQPTAFKSALLFYEPQSMVVGERPSIVTKLNKRFKDLAFWLQEYFAPLPKEHWYKRLERSLYRIKRWFALHPTIEERLTFIRNSDKITEKWPDIALTTLALVVSLEILLITPLISYHTSTYVIHFATLVVFAMLSTWALPFIVQNKSFRQLLKTILVFIYSFRLAWIGFNFVLIISLALFSPVQAVIILNSLVFASGRFAGILDYLPVQDPLTLTLSIIPSYLGLQLLSLFTVVGLLYSYFRLQRRILVNSPSINWRRQHWETVVALSIVAVTLLLTPLSDLIQGYIDPLLQPGRLVTYVLGIAAGLFVAWRRRESAK
jgi:Zn-dependent protease with chaperone function